MIMSRIESMLLDGALSATLRRDGVRQRRRDPTASCRNLVVGEDSSGYSGQQRPGLRNENHHSRKNSEGEGEGNVHRRQPDHRSDGQGPSIVARALMWSPGPSPPALMSAHAAPRTCECDGVSHLCCRDTLVLSGRRNTETA